MGSSEEGGVLQLMLTIPRGMTHNGAYQQRSPALLKCRGPDSNGVPASAFLCPVLNSQQGRRPCSPPRPIKGGRKPFIHFLRFIPRPPRKILTDELHPRDLINKGPRHLSGAGDLHSFTAEPAARLPQRSPTSYWVFRPS